MKKFTLLFLSIVLFGCASRKVTIAKEEIKTKTDSVSIVRIDSTVQINKNVYIKENFEEVEICPVTDTMPMIVNGITYKNAVLRYKKANKVFVDTSTKTVTKKGLKYVHNHKEQSKINKNKVIDKKANYFVYLWLLLIPIGMLIYREIKKKLFL